jgi:hypothetical protein
LAVFVALGKGLELARAGRTGRTISAFSVVAEGVVAMTLGMRMMLEGSGEVDTWLAVVEAAQQEKVYIAVELLLPGSRETVVDGHWIESRGIRLTSLIEHATLEYEAYLNPKRLGVGLVQSDSLIAGNSGGAAHCHHKNLEIGNLAAIF